VGISIAEAIGHSLRRARLAQGFTLKQVSERSAGDFKPSAVAGYERAERSISLERYCELCRFYGMEPAWLLAEILETVGGRPEVIVDLSRLEGLVPEPSTDG
jgi:transcriptional regulator with XRE-family HTH domain